MASSSPSLLRPHFPSVVCLMQTEVQTFYRIKQMHMRAKSDPNPVKRALGSAMLVVPVWL